MNYIDINLIEKMCHPLAVAVFDSRDDPISKFNEHEFELLDSALNNPRQTFGGEELYPTLIKKAAILYYGLIKNHAFKNGNKRIATASLLVFLLINDHKLEGPKQEIEDYLVNLAKKAASASGSEGKEKIIDELEGWLEKYLINVIR